MRSGMPSKGRAATKWCFCWEGDFWTVAYEGRVVRLKDVKGMHYLAQLLAHPGRRYHVCELAAVIALSARPARSAAAAPGRTAGCNGGCEHVRKAVTNRIRQTVARITASHPALGLHLRNAVHTGMELSYAPDRPTPWCVEWAESAL
jgi:hypothetical protein